MADMIPEKDRDELVRRVRRRVKDFCTGRGFTVGTTGACLYYAHFTRLELDAYFAAYTLPARCLIQAGSMSWPHMDMAKDDGLAPTHFSYEWDKNQAQQTLLVGDMPEMHVWNAIIRPLEHGDAIFVDLTTKYLPTQCTRTAGIEWTGDLPPDYLWATTLTFPDHVLYAPDKDATLLALRLIKHSGL